MGKPGPKPHRIISETWGPELAYAVGLLATDGCISSLAGGHLIDLTSKDVEQLKNFSKCVGLDLYIGKKSSGRPGKIYHRVQFKNVLFYGFLVSIGFTPAKSKTMGAIKVPGKYFFDFLRGAFDGDGSFYSYWDTRWRSSFMFYTSFVSASERHVLWLQSEIFKRLKIRGHITKDSRRITWQLKYAKVDSLKVLKRMYHPGAQYWLSRKRLKIERALGRVGLSL